MSSETRRFLPRTIGIYGPRNAGKTCYLATALLGMSTSSKCTVLLAEESSRELLLHHWEALKMGELPPATELALKPLTGSVVISLPMTLQEAPQEPVQGPADASDSDSPLSQQKRQLPFRTNDFGGRLAERGEKEHPELTEEFLRWLETSDCLLFFLAIDQLQDPNEAQDRLLEIDALLSRLIEKSPTGHAISCPIAVLVTKWDLVSDLNGSLEEEKEKLLQFLHSRAGQMGQAVCEKIKTVGEQVAIFPVSTFGGHVNGKPIHPMKPFNLHEPLVWALLQTDRCLYEKAQRQARESLGMFIWKNYGSAIKAYETLIHSYGINHGPIHDDIQVQLAELRGKRRRYNLLAGSIVSFIVVVLLAWFSYLYDRQTFINLTARLQAPREPYPALEEAAIAYHKTWWNLWAYLVGHKGRVQELWDQYQQECQQDYAKLEQLRRAAPPQELNAKTEAYRQFRDACKDFLARYAESPYENQVKPWLQETETQLQALDYAKQVFRLAQQWPPRGIQAGDQNQFADDLLRQADKLANQAFDAALAPEVAQAKATLDELMRNLKVYLGDIQARRDKYVADVTYWTRQVEAALKEQSPDLVNLQKLAQAGESLREQLPGDLQEATKQARMDLEGRLTNLQQKLSHLHKVLELWTSKAEEGLNRANNLLHSQAEDTSQIKDAIVNLQDQLRRITDQQFPRHDRIRELARKMTDRIDELQDEVDRYEAFDKRYGELIRDTKENPDDERRRKITAFLTDHLPGDYPRRKRVFAELGRQVESLGGSIDAARKEGVVRRFEELRRLADGLEMGRTIGEIRSAYRDFLKAADDYLRASDPPPQHPEEVDRLKKAALVVLDNSEWTDVRIFAGKNDMDFEQIARRGKEYLDGDDLLEADHRRHRKDAENLVKKAISDEWKRMYQVFYERATTIKEWSDVDEATRMGRDFLKKLKSHRNGWQGAFTPPAEDWATIEKQVRDWLEWAEKLPHVSERRVSLMVDPTPVTKDREIWIKAWLETRSSSTAQPARKPVTVVWEDRRRGDGQTDWFLGQREMWLVLPECDLRGSTGTLQLEITIDNFFLYPDTSSTVAVRLPQDFFSAESRRREFEFPGWEGKKAILVMKSPDLQPPVLGKPD